jgi:DnaJ-class molecular chaperone
MPIAPTLDYYAILRVSNTALVDEVKSSYRKLARDLHPDKNPHNPNATSNFQKVDLFFPENWHRS